MKRRRRRNAELYNLKGILIFLVVFGHLLEPQTGGAVSFLYLLIYSFHMPAFIFLSGWFSRKATFRRTLTSVLLPYLVFQVLYLLYVGQPVQLISPYWILWYLFSLFLWRLMTPLLRKWEPLAWLLFPVSVAVSLLCGYSPRIGYPFALSRTLVFLPYFLAGFALAGQGGRVIQKLRLLPMRLLSLAAVVGCSVCFWTVRLTFQRSWTFGASDYAYSGASAKIRFLLLVVALLWLWFLLAWTPERRIWALTTLGRNTLFVYLLHGFAKLWLDDHAEAVYHYGTLGNILLAFALSVVLCALFGNRWLAGAWQWLTSAWKYFLREIGRR